MPKITITKPFNFRKGLDVEHYAAGKKEVSQAVADHAYEHGFAEKPKAGAGSITVTDLKSGAKSGPHPVESMTIEDKPNEPRGKKTP